MNLADPLELLERRWGPGGEMRRIAAPGRVNLIGEHIDYHGLAVLPMAMERRVNVAFRARNDRLVRAVSGDGYGEREFEWTAELAPGARGDWANYLKAAAQTVSRKWGLGCGVDAAVVSDLPPAAGLSSSSALLVAFTLGLLWANRRQVSFEALMDVLPDGEHFVGTRGGGMDHAACLASRQGCASMIEFVPLSVRAVPVPEDWGFLVAHSLTTAEKAGAAREEYNARRAGGNRALERLGFASYREALEKLTPATAQALSAEVERDAFLHTTGEALRVRAAVAAMERADAEGFGRLLVAAHASARDLLRISCPALDRLVDAAMQAGALGARLTGAGFGGCAIVFCLKGEMAKVRAGLIARYYAGRTEFVERDHLIDTAPGAGAIDPSVGARNPDNA
jgi:galactokinase